jgi:hypothetical protein
MEADENADAEEAEDDPHEPQAGDALALPVPDREEGDEERDGRVRDRRDGRVDVLLAPGDQRERQRVVDQAEQNESDARGSQVAEGGPDAAAQHEERHEHEGGEQQPDGHHRHGLDLVHRDLDEHERRAPDPGHEEEERDVAAHEGAR